MKKRHSPKPYPAAKRRHPLPLQTEDASIGGDSACSMASTPPKKIVVIPVECSVLELKSRFKIYGPIIHTRMEPNGIAYIILDVAAQSAIDALLKIIILQSP